MGNDTPPAAESRSRSPAGRGSSKQHRGPSSGPPLAGAPFIDALPEAFCTHLVAFMPPWDIATLLLVSKSVQQAAALALRSWTLKGGMDLIDQAAARHFLQRAHNLHHFYLDQYREDVDGQLVQAISSGSAGAQLRSLRLAHLKAPIMRDFIGQLKAGRMPLLSELYIRVDHYREKKRG